MQLSSNCKVIQIFITDFLSIFSLVFIHCFMFSVIFLFIYNFSFLFHFFLFSSFLVFLFKFFVYHFFSTDFSHFYTRYTLYLQQQVLASFLHRLYWFFTTQKNCLSFCLCKHTFMCIILLQQSDLVYFTLLRLFYKIHINTASDILWKN